jgi:hypothetical protein
VILSFRSQAKADTSAPRVLTPLTVVNHAYWPAAKEAGEEEYNQLLQWNDSTGYFDRGFDRMIANVRKQLDQIEKKQRKEMFADIKFLRSHPVEGIPFEAMSQRAEDVFDIEMLDLYGWMMPQAINESLADESKKTAIPGYPLKIYITDSDFCDHFLRYTKEYYGLMDGLRGKAPDKTPGSCEGPLSGTHVGP